ncbi:ECF-type sigma factor [Rubrivirga sp. IMCC45206]|uniref:ECF-type sigma factor n=1 Tax=Rubrivirga sp. IMCC45206 TaxID=3391614 RepID=UPI00398FEF5A
MTRLLQEASDGRPEALDDVLPIVYDELQRLARTIRRGRRGQTLATTDLVHEAYFRLVRTDGVEWDGRRHFLRVAARAMRQVLVGDARRRGAGKRGGGQAVVTLMDDLHGAPPTDAYLLDLHAALDRLAALDARQASVVEVRFFGGLSIEETAEVLGVSTPTVNRDWKMARIWLARELAS